MKKALILIFSSGLLLLQGCFLYGKKDALSLSTTIKQKADLGSTLTSVNVSNNVVTIQGSGFSNVTSAKLTGTGLNANLSIDTKSDSQIIASATSAISLLVGETFNLIIGTADAQVTYTVTFTLQNGAIQLSHLSSLGATAAGQILKYDGTAWAPAYLAASQNYLGTWNATTYVPDITTLGSFNPGDYYIVDTAGTYTSSVLTTSPTVFAVGNWVMFNGSTWDKVLNGNLSGSGAANIIPYYSSSNVLANSPMSVSGSNIGIGTTTPGSSLDVKGVLRLSGATSGFVGIAPAAVAGGTTYTLPAADGTSGQVLTTNASGVLSWTSASVGGGTVTGVTSANADIGVASGTSAPVLTLNSGTSADQIVKLTSAAKLPAVDGSLLTNLTSTNLVGAVAVANGGTGATTLGASQSALGITIAGPLTGNVPALGATVIADRLCASDSAGGTISCINNLPAATVRGSVSETSGTGNLLFGTSPTITSPVITNIAPAADFTLTQSSVVPFTSVNTGAVANTLYLTGGKVGIGTSTPDSNLHISDGNNNIRGRIAIPEIGALSDKRAMIEVANFQDTGFTDDQYLNMAIYGDSFVGTSFGLPLAGMARIASKSTNMVIGNALSSGSLVLATNSTEVVRINSSGNVGIGTTTPVSKLNVAAAPSPVSSNGTLSIGSGFFDGVTAGKYVGNVLGTSLAINEVSGYAGDLINLQIAGASHFRVNTVSGTSVGVLSSSSTLVGGYLSVSGANFGTSGTLRVSSTNTLNEDITYTRITPTYNKPTATSRANTDLLINRTETNLGTTPTAQLLIDGQVGGVSRFNIDNVGNAYYAGKVGIGTASPSAQLHLSSSSTGGTAINIQNTDTGGHHFTIQSTASGNGPGAGSLRFYDYTAGIDRMIISPTGNVGIGTTSPSYKLHVVGSSGATVGYFSDGTATCSITPATAGNISCSSDERLKKNIKEFSDSLSLENVLKLKTVTYDWKNINNGTHTGYIAQDIEKVAPEFVTTGKDGFKQVSYAGFIPWITGAIKEFYKEFKVVVARVMILEDKMSLHDRAIASAKAEAKSENLALKAETLALKKENELMKAKLEKIEKLLEKIK